MSILEAVQTELETPVTPAPAPYLRGDRVTVSSPAGDRFLVRVEALTPTGNGDYTLVGAVVAPRRLRSHVVSTVVDARGAGPSVRPAA